MKNERLTALHLLTSLMQNETPLSHLFQSSSTTPFVKEICFGVLRHYFRLSAMATLLLKKRPAVIEIWLSLLMGLYQIHFLRIAEYAVVKETVALMDAIKKPWAKGLLNAVLRNFCRQQTTLLASLQNNNLFQWGHPEWFIRKIQQAWPQNWQSILIANDQHPPMSLRVNQQRSTVEAYLSRLHDQGMEAQATTIAHQGIVLTKPCEVNQLPEFKEGTVSVQDEAAQLAVTFLDLKPNIRVLDACAAPGGKTCHILETEANLAECVSIDIDSRRIARIHENLQRLSLSAKIIQADILNVATWWDGIQFDRILLDAPCSSTGVIRRHPDIKVLRTPENITAVAALQKQLLQVLWPLLAPQGRLVYATCSIMPEENEQQIQHFVQTHSDCIYLEKPLPCGHTTEYGQYILPGEANMDGFFYSVLFKQC